MMAYKTVLFILIFVSSLSLFATGGEIVFDPTVFEQLVQSAATATSTLSATTNIASSTGGSLALAAKNSAALGINNWQDASTIISQVNSAANVASSMTYAASDSVDTFNQLFPGKSSVSDNFTDTSLQRTTGVLNTLRGNLSAVQNLGDAITQYEQTLKALFAAQSMVMGQEAAAEQSNQIQGNMLNTLQMMLQSQLAMSGSQNAYMGYMTQQSEDNVQSQEEFLGNYSGNTNYKDNGQGMIPKGWY